MRQKPLFINNLDDRAAVSLRPVFPALTVMSTAYHTDRQTTQDQKPLRVHANEANGRSGKEGPSFLPSAHIIRRIRVWRQLK